MKVLVEVGQEVEAGQAVVVLEAMKMENQIQAEKSGKVKEIKVKLGDKVSKGTPLLRVQSSVPAAGGAAVAATLAPVSSTTVASAVAVGVENGANEGSVVGVVHAERNSDETARMTVSAILIFMRSS